MTLRRILIPLIAAAAGVLAASATPALAAPTRTCVPGDHADCRGVDLRYRDLHGVSLRKADLRGARLHFANLRKADLRGARLDGAVLHHADLRGARLDGANFTDAHLRYANLRGTRTGSVRVKRTHKQMGAVAGCPTSTFSVQVASFVDADLQGADLSNADDPLTNFAGANLTNAMMQQSNFAGANLTNANVASAWMGCAFMNGATMTGIVGGMQPGNPQDLPAGWGVVNNMLVGPGANLGGVWLGYVGLQGLNLHGANLTGTNLTGSILTGMDLSGINFSNTYLDGAQMANVNLSGATLSRVSMVGTNLTGANVRNASMWGNNLSTANVTNANFSGSFSDNMWAYQTVYSNTTCPDGSIASGADTACFPGNPAQIQPSRQPWK